MQSQKNGFFPGEPLIAVKEGDKYTVVEGNRRLTAVKLIHNPYECDRPSSRMIEIAESAKDKLGTLEKLPVIVRDTRAEILPYLGFRHITGVKQWEPLSKARYIEQLLVSPPQTHRLMIDIIRLLVQSVAEKIISREI